MEIEGENFHPDNAGNNDDDVTYHDFVLNLRAGSRHHGSCGYR